VGKKYQDDDPPQFEKLKHSKRGKGGGKRKKWTINDYRRDKRKD
jgi:hypothetical protein